MQASLRVGGGQLAPDLADEDVDVVILAGVRLAPDGPQEAAAGHDPAGVSQQDPEHLELAGCQVHGRLAHVDLVAGDVDDERVPHATRPSASAAGPAARRRSARRRAWSSAMPKGFVT